MTVGAVAPRAGSLAVSAVVCTYTDERWDQLVAAVASLRHQSVPPHEIIVIVDHNERLEARARRELSDVRVHPNHEAQGLSGGRNTALALAQAPLVAFLDDDAVAHAEWLARLATHFHSASVMGAGGRVEPMWETERPRWFPAEFDWVLGCSYRGLPEALAEVRNPFGGAMVVRREHALGVGGYSTDLGRIGKHPLGCEETELCLRIRRSEPRSVFLYEPRAVIAHHAPTSRSTFRYFRQRCYAEGLSKATVRSLAGEDDALSTEQRYVTRTLSRAVARGVGDALRGDAAGLARAGAIGAGLAFTVAGFARGVRADVAVRSTRDAALENPVLAGGRG